MKGTYLGEFEELVLLLVGIMGEEAYGLALVGELKKQVKRTATVGAVHSALSRLEDKGLLVSKLSGATKERGGRRKRVFEVTMSGKNALEISRQARASLWAQYELKTI